MWPRLAQKGDVICADPPMPMCAQNRRLVALRQICADLERLFRCSSFHFAVLRESRARAQPNKMTDQSQDSTERQLRLFLSHQELWILKALLIVLLESCDD
jgi:hypothetical protein